MSRDGLCFLFGAILTLVLVPRGPAAPPEDRGSKIETMLAVQAALEQGRDCLQRGKFQAAVDALENQVARVDGNRVYLNLLCDAYRGLIRELQHSNSPELTKYVERLFILNSANGLDGKSGRMPSASSREVPPPSEKSGPPALAQLAQATDAGARPIVSRGVAGDAGRDALAQTDLLQADLLQAASARGPSEAGGLLSRAEIEYSSRHYDAAARLFEQASRLDAKLVATAQERWAYCKLFAVTDLLNRSAVTERNAGEVEQEVRDAMAMSTRLDDFGKKLLREIQARVADVAGAGAAAIEVRLTPAREQGGWALAETANFRVYHRETTALAERVARIAEATRALMIRKWFDDDTRPWDRRCDVYLYATARDYATATGVPAGSPGHSTIERERLSDRILSRRIHLHCDNPNMIVAVLPHETTHVVLAGRFGPYDIPRWADEGMAVLSEPRERIDMHLRNLPWHNQERQLFPVGQLLRKEDYPDPRLIGPFYAQSVSIVEFLSLEKGPRVFAEFLADGLRGGYETALQKHYGIQSFHELDVRWHNYAFADRRPAAQLAGRTTP